jgi:hypothetical protein
VGTLLKRLRGGDRAEQGEKWVPNLAKALGPSAAQLQRMLRFADLYPTTDSVRELQDMNVDWTRLYIAFVVSDKGQRHELLREALEQGWTIEQMRFECRKRGASKRRAVGGRPRSKPQN